MRKAESGSTFLIAIDRVLIPVRVLRAAAESRRQAVREHVVRQAARESLANQGHTALIRGSPLLWLQRLLNPIFQEPRGELIHGDVFRLHSRLQPPRQRV